MALTDAGQLLRPRRLVTSLSLPRAAPPYATCLPDRVRLHPGDALSLQCLAHGSHPMTFEWSRTDRPNLPPGSETTKDGKLLVAQVKVSDSGTYKCVVTNHVGTSEAMARVVVKGELVCLFHS